jgi:gamma-glutamyltranspeptidase / glutathione hydrolase
MVFPSNLAARDRWQARSMVISARGIVATSQPLASQAGAQILARGGSAADAALAANAVLSVVEPMMSGIGGDLFALYREAASGHLYGLNASGPAPRGLSIEFLRRQGADAISGIHAVTVPGCVRGWEGMHERFGRVPWRHLFQPAMYYCERGFPVTEVIQGDWEDSANRAPAPVPRVGEMVRNPHLAHAYGLIAELGAAAFYAGPIGEALIETSRRLGGTMTAADLEQFAPEWVTPISTTYRDWAVYELPPNGQGAGALEMLNIMERFPLGDYGPASAAALHCMIEAQKLAYEDLEAYNADPRLAHVPLRGLLDKRYAGERAALIDPVVARSGHGPGGPARDPGNTTYLAVVDKDGNVASWIQSIADLWGTGIMVEGFGFPLHSRGEGFTMDPAHPNALAAGKRPYHTIIPGYMERGNAHVGFGIMRGVNQAQAHAQFVSHIADHGMNIQQALEAPRFTRVKTGGREVKIESRVPESVRGELAAMGHDVTTVGEYSGWMGGGNAVLHDSSARVNYGASSPRKDGTAIPEADPWFG